MTVAAALTGAARPGPAHQPAVTLGGIPAAITAVSPSDAWLVGTTDTAPVTPWTAHWDGTAWSTVPGPDIPKAFPEAVSMSSASNGWAVGQYFPASGGQSKTLILHWDGTAWTQVSSPNPARGPGGVDELDGVSTVSATDAWAVGYYITATTDQTKTLILHWNGTSWVKVRSPNPVPGLGHLWAVSASSATDAWAVGSAGRHTLTVHWNGTAWSHVRSMTTSGNSSLGAVSDESGTDAWAVGVFTNQKNQQRTLTLHWNGTSWTRVNSSTGIPGRGSLDGVSAISPTDAWTVGGRGTHTESSTVLMHWDGTSWKQAPMPSGAASTDGLSAISMDSSSDGWALGPDVSGDTILLRWNGTTWTQY